VARKIPKQCLDFIISYEKFRSKPYDDGFGIPTVGYGSTYYEDGTKVKLTDPPLTKERASILFLFILEKFAKTVLTSVKVELNDNQFSTLLSLAYNIGASAFAKSTLVKRLNEKKYDEAADQFLVWNKSGGEVVRGLTRRRKDERDLFLKPIGSVDNVA
jgi:lysozyme